ncbi:hypothetical protein [Thiohalocapsa marina]|uniref:hypothetical protein n=1 Tax=Thiohalocapsa marina TaxID=424902 RepID=UPI0036D79D08
MTSKHANYMFATVQFHAAEFRHLADAIATTTTHALDLLTDAETGDTPLPSPMNRAGALLTVVVAASRHMATLHHPLVEALDDAEVAP